MFMASQRCHHYRISMFCDSSPHRSIFVTRNIENERGVYKSEEQVIPSLGEKKDISDHHC